MHEEGSGTLQVAAHRHGLSRSGSLIEHRGIGNRHARQIADHGLKVNEGLHTALGDLGLIGRVSGVPARVLEDIAADNGGKMGAVIAHPEVGGAEFVLRGEVAELGKGLLLRGGHGQVERAIEADLGGNRLLDQLPE